MCIDKVKCRVWIENYRENVYGTIHVFFYKIPYLTNNNCWTNTFKFKGPGELSYIICHQNSVCPSLLPTYLPTLHSSHTVYTLGILHLPISVHGTILHTFTAQPWTCQGSLKSPNCSFRKPFNLTWFVLCLGDWIGVVDPAHLSSMSFIHLSEREQGESYRIHSTPTILSTELLPSFAQATSITAIHTCFLRYATTKS